ncbi:MAG: DUF5320 domain-containing protein [Candidatus Cloacimonetes bacterium]|nr:DUF5320 domain-containing protein [Candidatus Cloacimonadota bacterium]MDY0171818.1 DUF5320 domain-containing protein [Candidatus Cloacimonadaceae bacterium]
MPRRDGTGPQNSSVRGRGLGDCGKPGNSQNPVKQGSSSNTLIDVAAQVLLSLIRSLTSKKPDHKQE